MNSDRYSYLIDNYLHKKTTREEEKELLDFCLVTLSQIGVMTKEFKFLLSQKIEKED